jgi:ribosomal protein L3
MRRVLAAVVLGLVAFVAVTVLALEGREVVVVETAGGDGGTHRTRTWIADDDEGAWIEAANPERPFVADVQKSAALVLERAGVRRACRAELVPNPDGHERVRRLLHDRYGWADCWIGLLADTHASLAVRVRCA